MDQPLLFLIKLAWACRYRLPILITIGFMALDVRMQLEIHVQMRRIRREPALPLRGGRNSYENVLRTTSFSDDLESNSSWSTIDDDEEDSINEEIESVSQHSNLQKVTNASSVTSQSHNNLLNVNVEN